MVSERKPKFVDVKLVDIDKVYGATYNPRVRDPERFELVKLSLSKLGWLLPMYVTEKGEILSGHQRLDAAKEIGAKRVPVVIIERLDPGRQKGVNIVFNRATNDMHKYDHGGDLSAKIPMSIIEEAAKSLPDIDPDSNAFFPCKNLVARNVPELVHANMQQFLRHAIRQAESLYHWGRTSIPLVVTDDNRVINGVGRMQHAGEVGMPQVQTVYIEPERAELARILLNKLSMDFDLEDKYSEVLRYNSFRRAANVQNFLMPTHSADLVSSMSKSGKTQRPASVFEPDNKKHVIAWRRWYGNTVLDFGAGLLDKALIMRDVMGIDCLAFEPYYTGGKDAGFDVEGARYITDVFLDRIADGLEFDSIFLASVLNSVPFKADRLHIINIVSALATKKTIVYAGAISKTSDRYLAATGQKDNISNHETQFDSSFAVGYEEGVMVSDLMKRPKAQKYHSPDEWKEIWSTGFSDVHVYIYHPNDLVQAICKKPLEIDPEALSESIKFEFDLPFPDTTLDRVDKALEAFSKRLGMRLE